MRLIGGHCQPPPPEPVNLPQKLALYRDNPNIYGYHLLNDSYVCHAVLGTDPQISYDYLTNAMETYGSQTSQVFFHVDSAPSPVGSMSWWIQFAQVGDATVHYNYPITQSAFDPDSGTIVPTPVNTIAYIAGLSALQANTVEQQKPAWFIQQAWSGSFFGTSWCYPTSVESRAMAYSAIIHGATGLWQFVWDSSLSRAGGVNGISPSQPVWSGISAYNQELAQLTPAILSATAPDGYRVFVDSTGFSGSPIHTILKKYNNDYYLFAVNLDNQNVNAKFQFASQPSNTTTLFEEGRLPAIQGNSILDTFSAFAVHIYKFRLNTPPIIQILDPDVNDNGQVNITDAQLVLSQGTPPAAVGDSRYEERYDLNGSGVINITDATLAQVNGTPQIQWPPANLPEGEQLIFYVKGADPNGDALSYSAANLPVGSCFNGKFWEGSVGFCGARQFSWTPLSTQSGNYNITFTVSDGALTTSISLPITVLNSQ